MSYSEKCSCGDTVEGRNYSEFCSIMVSHLSRDPRHKGSVWAARAGAGLNNPGPKVYSN